MVELSKGKRDFVSYVINRVGNLCCDTQVNNEVKSALGNLERIRKGDYDCTEELHFYLNCLLESAINYHKDNLPWDHEIIMLNQAIDMVEKSLGN